MPTTKPTEKSRWCRNNPKQFGFLFYERRPSLKSNGFEVSFHPKRCDCGMFGHTSKRTKSLYQRMVLCMCVPVCEVGC